MAATGSLKSFQVRKFRQTEPRTRRNANQSSFSVVSPMTAKWAKEQREYYEEVDKYELIVEEAGDIVREGELRGAGKI